MPGKLITLEDLHSNQTYLADDKKIIDAGEITRCGRLRKYWAQKHINEKAYCQNAAFNIQAQSVPQAFIDHFDLASVDFGRWMTEQDRVQFLYAAADGLHQLARLIGVADKDLGMNKKLTIGLGSMGMGGHAAAFYMPGCYAINITKPHVAAGALAHEFAHAIDNLVCAAAKCNTKKKGYLTGGSSARITADFNLAKEASLEGRMELLFYNLYYDKSAGYSNFREILKDTTEYTKRRTEVWARTIEAWTSYKLNGNGANTMLCQARYSHESYPSKALIGPLADYIKELLKNIVLSHKYGREIVGAKSAPVVPVSQESRVKKAETAPKDGQKVTKEKAKKAVKEVKEKEHAFLNIVGDYYRLRTTANSTRSSKRVVVDDYIKIQDTDVEKNWINYIVIGDKEGRGGFSVTAFKRMLMEGEIQKVTTAEVIEKAYKSKAPEKPKEKTIQKGSRFLITQRADNWSYGNPYLVTDMSEIISESWGEQWVRAAELDRFKNNPDYKITNEKNGFGNVKVLDRVRKYRDKTFKTLKQAEAYVKEQEAKKAPEKPKEAEKAKEPEKPSWKGKHFWEMTQAEYKEYNKANQERMIRENQDIGKNDTDFARNMYPTDPVRVRDDHKKWIEDAIKNGKNVPEFNLKLYHLKAKEPVKIFQAKDEPKQDVKKAAIPTTIPHLKELENFLEKGEKAKRLKEKYEVCDLLNSLKEKIVGDGHESDSIPAFNNAMIQSNPEYFRRFMMLLKFARCSATDDFSPEKIREKAPTLAEFDWGYDYPAKFRLSKNVKPVRYKEVPGDEGLANLLKNIISKDEFRPAMTGIFFDRRNNAIVATDSFRLAFLPAKENNILSLTTEELKAIKEKESNLTYKTSKGNIYNLLGKEINENYPPWLSVLPDYNLVKANLDTQELYNAVYSMDHYYGMLDEVSKQNIVLKLKDQYSAFNRKYWLDGLEFLLKAGVKKIDIIGSEPNRAFLLMEAGHKIDFKAPFFLTMPIRLDNYEGPVGMKPGLCVYNECQFSKGSLSDRTTQITKGQQLSLFSQTNKKQVPLADGKQIPKSKALADGKQIPKGKALADQPGDSIFRRIGREIGAELRNDPLVKGIKKFFR